MPAAKSSKSKIDKYLILCGFIGAVIFLLATAVMGAMYPGYDHVGMVISELGAPDSPVHLLMNVFGFGLFGVFIILFSIGVYRSSELRTAGRLSSVFFFLTGVLMILVGISPTYIDIGVYTPDDLHQLAVICLFPVMTVGLLLFAFDAWRNRKIRWLAPFILAVGSVTLVLGYFYLFTWPQPLPTGITQRLALAFAFSMLAIVSIKLYKAQFNAPVRRWLLGAALVVLIAIAVAAPQQLAINESRAGLPNLRGLCYGEDGCSSFCHGNFGTCSSICAQEPGNPLCDLIAVLRTGS